MTSQVRTALAESEHSRRMLVLGDGDVLDIMAARDPAQALAARLQAKAKV
jgi:hypothetical protein